jgi:hypothetical protein
MLTKQEFKDMKSQFATSN